MLNKGKLIAILLGGVLGVAAIAVDAFSRAVPEVETINARGVPDTIHVTHPLADSVASVPTPFNPDQ